MKSSRYISLQFLAIILPVLLIGNFAVSQNFKLMRYDESYESLKYSSVNTYNKVKFIALNKEKVFYLSLGGEARYEYVDYNNEDWGRFNIDHNNFLLQRYAIHTDLHLGKTFRFFVQLRSAFENGRINGPRAIDEDQLNVQNLFLDMSLWQKKDTKLTFRGGRQELDYGSGRLISVREGPNVRLYFTGAKIMYSSPRFSIDGFALMADAVQTGVFDNKMSKQLNLWGTYCKIILPKAGNLDFYYLGIKKKESLFEEGIASEKRHTIGLRLWKYGGGFIYNLETAYQFGSFGTGNINAWTASADLGYSFENLKFKPTINLRNDYISGDKNRGDGNLETFNPLYPKAGYLGFSPQVGPVNLIDIHPYATLELMRSLTLQLDMIFYWRYSLQDGVYRPSGTLNLPGSS